MLNHSEAPNQGDKRLGKEISKLHLPEIYLDIERERKLLTKSLATTGRTRKVFQKRLLQAGVISSESTEFSFDRQNNGEPECRHGSVCRERCFTESFQEFKNWEDDNATVTTKHCFCTVTNPNEQWETGNRTEAVEEKGEPRVQDVLGPSRKEGILNSEHVESTVARKTGLLGGAKGDDWRNLLLNIRILKLTTYPYARLEDRGLVERSGLVSGYDTGQRNAVRITWDDRPTWTTLTDLEPRLLRGDDEPLLIKGHWKPLQPNQRVLPKRDEKKQDIGTLSELPF